MPSLSEETGGRVSMLMPGSTIGIIGGGQLGRMMALSARYMGFRVGVLDPTPNCPTGQVADFQITAEYDDKTAILIGKKTENFFLLQSSSCNNHFIPASSKDFQTHAFTIFIQKPRNRIIGLIFYNSSCRVSV